MKTKTSSMRKSSALLAASAGVAVCITGGGAQAAKVTGTIAGSNAAATVFSGGAHLKAFASQASWSMFTTLGGPVYFAALLPGFVENVTAGLPHYIYMLPAGVSISSAMPNGFSSFRQVQANVLNKYIAVEFKVGPFSRFGWIHVVSTNGSATQITLDKWGYENTGASIKTLSDSVAPRKLALSDGRVRLQWTNANEDGVSRYEVQAKDASGAWKAVNSAAPGSGQYSATVAKDAQCRLVVEKVDGTSEEVNF